MPRTTDQAAPEEKENEMGKKMSTTLENRTPHGISVHLNGEVRDVAAAGTPPRVAMEKEKVGEVNGIPVLRSTPGEVTNEPEPVHGTVYIVSRLVAAALPERDDLVFPDGLVRDSTGKVIGCDSFGRV